MDIATYKQVISDAIKGEVEAKEFYEKVAERIKDNSLSELFKGFAREEASHENILTGILNQGKIQLAFFDFEKDYSVAETIEMPTVNENMDLKGAIGIAMKNEEAAMKKYMALAENCNDGQLKKVFQDLAAMERGHKFKMEERFVDVAYPEIW